MARKVSEENKKKRFALWVKDSTLDLARKWHEEDDCATISEYIEKAILFYSGYIQSGKNENYLPNIVVSTLKSIMRDSENRHNKMLYKICVEISLMMNVLAASTGIDKDTIGKMRKVCEEEVRKLNGMISLYKAVEWQS